MSNAIIRGMLAKSLVKPSQIRVSSPSGPSSALRALGVFATTKNDECVTGANVIVLAVKPFNIGVVLSSCRASITPDAAIISIAAGMKIAQIGIVRFVGRGVARRCPHSGMFRSGFVRLTDWYWYLRS
jgi:pyrroline-5-carboxylate reductase